MATPGRSSRLPRSRLSPVPGTMAAPRWVPLILAAKGTQIFDGARWWTIDGVWSCTKPTHPAPCSVFRLPDLDDGALLHWHLTDEGWLRHPVEAS